MASDDVKTDVTDDLLDDEMESLFAALGDVSATEDFLDATIDRIAEASQDDAAEAGAPGKAAVTAQVGGSAKTSRRARWRAIRVAAVAACLALALGGGVAYAVPTSRVTVSQGDAAIELGVNRFGVVVSATSDSDEGREAIDAADLLNKGYEDSLGRAVDALSAFAGDEPVSVRVESDDGSQRERLEGQSEPYDGNRRQGDPGQGAGSDPDVGQAPGGDAPSPESGGEPDHSDAGQGGPGTERGQGNPGGEQPQGDPGGEQGAERSGGQGPQGGSALQGDPSGGNAGPGGGGESPK